MTTERQSDWLLVGAAIIIIGIFGGGYRMGMSGEANSSKDSLTTIKSQERATAKLVKTCNDASATFTSSDKDLQAQIEKLRGDVNIENVNHDYLYQANGKRTEAVTTCVGEMETQAAAWEEEDIKYKDKIAGLTTLNKGLVAKIDALANSRGQPRNYLNQALDRVRWENVRMRIKLKMIEMPENGNFQTRSVLKKLEDEIVATYAGRTENVTGVLDVTPGENATYSGRKRATFQFEYNKTKHNNIFLYQKMEDGHLKRPVFFGRDGTNPIDQGVTGIDANISSSRMHKKYLRMASIPRVFKSLYNYALCAYRNNNRNITFPDVFLLKPPSMANVTNTSAASKAIAKLTGEPERAHASALFDTPLLTFCRDCKHMSNTSEFKLACLGDTVDVQYGSYDFWAMRSMLRWNPLAYEKAQAFLSGVSWGGDDKPYIGVVYRTDQRTLKDCQRYKKPQRHYLYLAKNQPASRTNMLAWSAQQNVNKTVTHGNTTVELPKRSEPACAVSYAELMKNMAAVMTRTGIKRFYISTKHNALASLKKRVAKVFGNDQEVEVEWQTPRMNQPEEQLTDLVVLESSQYLLIDAFTEHSQVVAESYLIRNEFNTDKLFVM